jgi:hypothetical protein
MHRPFRIVLRYSPVVIAVRRGRPSLRLLDLGYVRHSRGRATGDAWRSWVPLYGSNQVEA